MQIISQDGRTILPYRGVQMFARGGNYSLGFLTYGKFIRMADGYSYEMAAGIMEEIANHANGGRDMYFLP